MPRERSILSFGAPCPSRRFPSDLHLSMSLRNARGDLSIHPSGKTCFRYSMSHIECSGSSIREWSFASKFLNRSVTFFLSQKNMRTLRERDEKSRAKDRFGIIKSCIGYFCRRTLLTDLFFKRISGTLLIASTSKLFGCQKRSRQNPNESALRLSYTLRNVDI